MPAGRKGFHGGGHPVRRAAVIVVNYASATLITRSLPGLERVLDVIVVDSFSTAAEAARVAALGREHGWHVLLLDRNLGFGGGVNAGVQAARQRGADVVLTLNPDAVATPGVLSALADAAAEDPDTLVSPLILTSAGVTWFGGSDLYLDDGTTAGRRRRSERAGRPRQEWATGCCFAVSGALWDRVGGFDEDYFMYWEDVDLSTRVLAAGGRLVLRDDLTIIHDEGQTGGRAIGDRKKSPLYYEYNIRNRLLYAAKHLDDEGLRTWVRSAPAVALGVLLQGGRRQLVTSTVAWRAMLRGLRRGRAGVRKLRGSSVLRCRLGRT